MSHKVLIVDDIVINRVLLTEYVKKLGYAYEQAANGQEAIDKIQREKIDLILMDIEMPVMNGIETTQYIRSEMDPPYTKIPIIALTAHNPNDFFETFDQAGFNDLITKPYLLDKISKILTRVLEDSNEA